MSSKYNIENILIQVRVRLQENGVKLWMVPYYIEGIGPVDVELEQLAGDFSDFLGIPFQYCLAALNELQTNAIDKLRARDDFHRTGIATVKVRVPNQVGGTRLLTVHVDLHDLATALYEKTAQELSISEAKLKLISAGKIVQRHRILDEQGITNNQQVMAVVLASTPDEANTNNEMYDKVQKTKEDASLLVNSQRMMEMEDQDGNVVHLPPAEKRALMLALALHEKGQAALKREQFTEALILLLEADNEYNSCNSNMLEKVDNYALLNMEIVWCYLMLKSVNQLPDAEKRLQICEQNFKRSYGQNLDRVVLLKGSAVNEKCLIMRLHLLKGILSFYRNDRLEARRLLKLAEHELKLLKIDEECLQSLTEMGYAETEARIGLRACANNIEQAIAYIIDRRDTRKKARKLGRQEERVKNSLAKTADDDKWVNPRNLHILSEMGFNKDLCAVALKKSDNDLNRALSLLQENQTTLQAELTETIVADNDITSQMVNMGFHADIVKMALRRVANNMDEAVEMLLQMQNNGLYDNFLTNVLELAASSTGARPSTSTASPIADLEKRVKKEAELMEAFERFSEDVENVDDAHLDLSLAEEEALLTEYKQFLED